VEEVFRQFEEFFVEPRPEDQRDPRSDDSRIRDNPSPSLAIRIEATVMFLVSRLIDLTEKEYSGEDHSGLERLRPAVDFMDANFLRNPSIEEIADRIQLSPNYFHRFFKQQAGTTPFKYMENRRLDLARKLLFDQRMNISQIAQETGYESLGYFSRAFRRRFGVSPSQLRQAP
jgi:AraC-like DNA-binding protein